MRRFSQKLLIGSCLVYSLPLPAYAGQTFTVTDPGAVGPGTLADEITNANNAGGENTIDFDPSLAGATITPIAQLVITDPDLTIDGSGADALVIGNMGVNFNNHLTLTTDETFEFNNSLSGTGSLTTKGPGVITFSGDNSAFTGDTTAYSGILSVTGNFGSNFVQVNPGAILSGTGAINGDVNNDGTVTPGLLDPEDSEHETATGTLTVNNYSGGGKLQFDARSGGISTMLNVAGSADFDPDTAILSVFQNGANIGDSFTVVNAPGGVFGDFSEIDTLIDISTTPYTGQYFDYVLTPTQVIVTLFPSFSTQLEESSSFTSMGTEVQNSILQAANAMSGSARQATGDFKTVIQAMQKVPSNQKAQALNLVTGSTKTKMHDVVKSAIASHAARTSNRGTQRCTTTGFLPFSPEEVFDLAKTRSFPISRRVHYLRNLDQLLPSPFKRHVNLKTLLEKGDVPLIDQQAADNKAGIWLQGIRTFDTIKTGNTTHGRTGGIQTGIDYRFTERNLTGFSFSQTRTSISAPRVKTKGHVNSSLSGFYGSWNPAPVFFLWSITGAVNEHKMSRHIVYSTINRVARSSFRSYLLGASTETGYTWSPEGYTFKPSVIVRGIKINRPRYAEDGAGALNLLVGHNKTDGYTVGAALKGSTIFKVIEDRPLYAELRASYEREVKQPNVQGNMKFTSGVFIEQNQFVTNESVLVKNIFTGGFASTFAYSKNLTISANYLVILRTKNLKTKPTQISHAITGGFRFMW